MRLLISGATEIRRHAKLLKLTSLAPLMSAMLTPTSLNHWIFVFSNSKRPPRPLNCSVIQQNNIENLDIDVQSVINILNVVA